MPDHTNSATGPDRRRRVEVARFFREAGLMPLSTSDGLGWRGVHAARLRHWSPRLEQPTLEDHVVTVALGLRHRRAVERGPAGGLSGRALGLVADYAGDNLAGDLSLKRMARVASVSPHRFSRAFKKSTGLTPHQYVIVQRVERAKGLLLRGRPVGAVAGACGFSDQSHLSRHFKRLCGVTPALFRREAGR
jgi:transcriptional regulator GlxA family with amidase domain